MKFLIIIIVAILFVVLMPNTGSALSYRCTTTGSARVAKVFIIQNAEVDNGGGSAKNKKGYIALDDKRKIFGVSTRGASAVAQYIEFEAREQKYLIIVRIPIGIGNENQAYVDVMPESSYDNNLKHWVSCEKIEDVEFGDVNIEKAKSVKANTVKDDQAKLQKFCKLKEITGFEEASQITDETPVPTEVGEYHILTYSNGATIKVKKDTYDMVSFTLPPGLVCKK